MVPLFKSLFRPSLEYGNGNAADVKCKELRRFIKHITGMNNLEYEQRLMALKLPCLEYRRARGNMSYD